MSPSPKVGSFDWPSSIQGQAISRRNIKTAEAETHKYHALLTIFGLGMLSLCFNLAKYEYLMNFKSLMQPLISFFEYRLVDLDKLLLNNSRRLCLPRKVATLVMNSIIPMKVILASIYGSLQLYSAHGLTSEKLLRQRDSLHSNNDLDRFYKVFCIFETALFGSNIEYEFLKYWSNSEHSFV